MSAELSLATDFKVRDMRQKLQPVLIYHDGPTKCIYTGLELLQANQEEDLKNSGCIKSVSTKSEGLNCQQPSLKLRTGECK